MKKALIVTSVASMVDQFLLPSVRLLQEMDYEVHVACNFVKGSTCSDERIKQLREKLTKWAVPCIQIDFARDVMNFSENTLAYKQINKLLSESFYDIIHCHSPIGGLITRLAARKTRKKGTKVFYTAHGFHFYKGSPKKNWLLYYPVEKVCSYFTDVMITINQEDYALAQKKMKAKKVEYVPGIGLDLSKFGTIIVDKESKREELKVPVDAVMLLSVGELNENKNHETVIRAMANMENVYYIIAGRGRLQGHLQSVIDELGIADRVKLLGYRNDIGELCETADIYVMSSYREGLSVALMEAMASGLPCVVSRIRGNTDLIDENGGALFNPHSVEDCQKAIQKVLSSEINNLSAYNLEKIKGFSLVTVNQQMNEIIFGRELPLKCTDNQIKKA